MSVLSASEVVEAGLDAYDRDHALVVPGAVNHLQTTAVKFLPRTLVSKAARWTLKRRAERR
jgi:short-subunit dehydrogenase